MLVPKKDRLTIYRYLFKEGVMVAKKDCNKEKHDDPELDVRNIYVIKLLTSLKSRGYVTERFSWQWYYWYLTNEGIAYLREYLHLPQEIVPNTLKKSSRPASRGVERGERGEGEKGGSWGKGGRDDGYRRGFDNGGKGGFGRGGGAAY
jgi:small subunit ribosomal protein S10e